MNKKAGPPVKAKSTDTVSSSAASTTSTTTKSTGDNRLRTTSSGSESDYQSTVESSENGVTILTHSRTETPRNGEDEFVLKPLPSNVSGRGELKQRSQRIPNRLPSRDHSTAEVRVQPKKQQGPEPVNKAKQVTLKSFDLLDLQYPLLLRVNPLFTAKVVQLSGILLTSPVMAVEVLRVRRKQSGQYRLVPGLETCLECTGTLPSLRPRRAELQFILYTAVQQVTAIVLPPVQQIKTGSIPRRTDRPQLLLPPEGPHKAEVLPPLWDTVTYTVAQGKHVAVEYSIPTVPTRKARYYKARKEKTQPIAASTLYRKTDRQPVVVWRAEKVHRLELSTVEQADPMLVHRVRLEQNPIYRTQRHQINTPEYLGTSQVEVTSTRSTTFHNQQNVKTIVEVDRNSIQNATLVRHWERDNSSGQKKQ